MWIFLFGAGGENRTRLSGLGSPHSTDELRPHNKMPMAFCEYKNNLNSRAKSPSVAAIFVWREEAKKQTNPFAFCHAVTKTNLSAVFSLFLHIRRCHNWPQDCVH